LWCYGFFNEQISISGDTRAYLWNRKFIEFHFCVQCGCVVHWCAATVGADGRHYGAINLRLAADPDAAKAIVLVHHDTDSMSDLPPDGRCVADVWA
jgi:hypothetical protein